MRTIVSVTSHPDQRSALALKALRAMLFRRIISIWWAPITRSCWPPASCQAALAIASSLVCSWTDFSGVDFLAIGKF